jgi:hypothetical protein
MVIYIQFDTHTEQVVAVLNGSSHVTEHGPESAFDTFGRMKTCVAANPTQCLIRLTDTSVSLIDCQPTKHEQDETELAIRALNVLPLRPTHCNRT